MKEKTTDIDILEELKPEKMDLIQLIRTFKREGIENFITIRREKFETLIAENKELKEENKKIKQEYINPNKARISYFDYRKRTNVVIEGFIPKSKVEGLLKEIQEEGQIAYKNFMTKKLEEDFEIDGAILQELGYIEGKLQSLLGKE